MSNAAPIAELELIAREIRARLVRMSHDGRAPHLGSSMSCVDLLTAAYWGTLNLVPDAPDAPDRDRFILSKGHAAAALYATLSRRGYFSDELLDTYNKDGGRLPEHPSPGALPGIEAATGSLGHGLPLGLGLALAARIQRLNYRVVVVMSDGECNEGSVWESAMFAAAQRADNLVTIIDYNRWQATGRSEEVMALAPLADKWQAFGWSASEIDGHDLGSIQRVLRHIPAEAGKPTAVVAHTVKGKGVSFMEDDNNWHYRIPNDDELIAALDELRPG